MVQHEVLLHNFCFISEHNILALTTPLKENIKIIFTLNILLFT